MSYTPPDRHALLLKISGAYTPPDRHSITLRINPSRVVGSTAQGQSVGGTARLEIRASGVSGQGGQSAVASASLKLHGSASTGQASESISASATLALHASGSSRQGQSLDAASHLELHSAGSTRQGRQSISAVASQRLGAVGNTAQGQSAQASVRLVLHAIVALAQGQHVDGAAHTRAPVHRYVLGQAGIAWRQGAALDVAARLAWQRGVDGDAQRRMPQAAADAQDAQRTLPWGRTRVADQQAALPVTEASGYDAQRELPWRRLAPRDRSGTIRWQGAVPDDTARDLPWRRLDPNDRVVQLPTRRGVPQDVAAGIAWGVGQLRDSNARLPWRRGLLQWVWLPQPPTPPHPPVKPGCYVQPDRRGLVLALGGRIAYAPPDRHSLALRLDCNRYRRFDVRRTLRVSHSLSVVRLPDRLPLKVKSLTLSTDRNSWPWTCNLTLADYASLLALEPTPSGVASVEISLDGYVFVVQVGGYSESRAMNAHGGTVTARSRTENVDTPYAPQRAYTSTADATAQQLATAELDFTDIALDWRIDDWLVPAGAYAYDRETPLSAISKIASAAGAMLQSAQDSDTLIVAPRQVSAPWHFDEQSPDFTLAGGSWLSAGKKWNGGQRYNGVYLSGQSQGVLANVYRDGTAGSPYAPLIVDALLTDSAPARLRGISVLADSLPRHEIPIELPLLPSPAAPGLLLPGELGEIVDTRWGTFRAVVDALQITASVDNNGVVTARQNATLWRYLP